MARRRGGCIGVVHLLSRTAMLDLHVVPGAFSTVECARILHAAAGCAGRDAGLVAGRADHNIRRAEIVWLDSAPDVGWVMDRTIALVAEANRSAFGFDLTEFGESPQVARYDAATGGHFDWHSDIGAGALASRRKLTLVVQLSPPGDYEGGTLEVRPDILTRSAPRGQGDCALFPSFLLHRVTPVTAGTRHSLTTWVHGPPFR